MCVCVLEDDQYPTAEERELLTSRSASCLFTRRILHSSNAVFLRSSTLPIVNLCFPLVDSAGVCRASGNGAVSACDASQASV